MRDQHRSKQELCDEVAGLRKQVADLKAEMVIRRRVEDALRHSEEQLRALADSAPAALCIVRPGGTVRVANLPFARLLGYDSAAELQRLSEAFGLFAAAEELGRVLQLREQGVTARFRRKDGSSLAGGVVGGPCVEGDGVALAVLGGAHAVA
jgi:PAS domain S-box-containing protein